MSQRLVAVFTPFEDLTDPRIEHTRVHDLFELIVVALCGTIAGADSWADIERFGLHRLAWLQTFLRLKSGIPSHDTFGRVFARLDPAELINAVTQWLDEIGRDIAIDGKTLRGSFDTAAGRQPLHLVSAWATEARLTLGQIAVDSKSNEITAIPLLLELLNLKGATITIDAMGCQKEIAAKIVEGGGDYVLALKGNHERLHQAVVEEFAAVVDADLRAPGLRRHVSVETNHGRQERREYFVMPAPRHLSGFAEWSNLTSIGMVVRITQNGDKETGEAHRSDRINTVRHWRFPRSRQFSYRSIRLSFSNTEGMERNQLEDFVRQYFSSPRAQKAADTISILKGHGNAKPFLSPTPDVVRPLSNPQDPTF